ncbi:MAG: Fic family protein [Kofleriaceae bacterium]
MQDFQQGHDTQSAAQVDPALAEAPPATAPAQFSGGPIPAVSPETTSPTTAPTAPAASASERAYDAPAAAPAAAPVAPAAAPDTLGALLAKTGKTVEQLKVASSYELTATAQQLLVAKGVTSPTQSQKDETVFKMNEAIQSGSWESFTAPFGNQVLKLEDGVNERLGNIFFEKKVFTPEQLEPDKLKMNEGEKAKLEGGFESGVTGMVLAASFINTSRRAEGDFSHAYGDQAWKGFVRAETFLNEIPKGQFLERLDVTLMQEINRLIHAPDTGMKAAMLRTIAMIGRGGRWDHGGELRDGRQFARPDNYEGPELENLKEAGVHVNQLSHKEGGGGKAMLEYPKPEEVHPGLERIIAELKADLAVEKADPIGAAAKFQRHFVALHPFGDSNGRTSRILMNRILSEYDFPPAILADQNKDISLSPDEWRTEVAKGVARSKEFLGGHERKVESKDGYIERLGVKGAVPPSPNKPITIDGNPFDLGSDGLLYDPTGRPYIVSHGELVPMAQMEHFVMSRRIAGSGATAGADRLQTLTADTRALYDKVVADPDAGKGIVVRDDAAARKADTQYKLAPEPEVAQMLTDLTDVSKLDAAAMFKIQGGTGRGTAISATLSKHAQIDLEFWYVEKGLRDSGHDDLVEQVRVQRAALFGLAKAELDKHKDPKRVSSENPMGFKFEYEKMMFDTSPLRFESFEQAVDEIGDQKMTVWRGDYSFARIIGMAPNNDIRQPDAKSVASDRADNNQITNIYDDLVKLEGSAVGRQYICTTSDLALLAGSFANSEKGQTVNIGSLPGPIKERLLAWIAPEFPEGTTDADKETARKQQDERGDSVLPTSDGGKEIRDAFGIPGTIVKVKVIDRAAGTVQITASRKAFQMVLDKDALLPGIYALGGPSFESEQEIHGLERVAPWSIKSTHKADTLKKEFPEQGPAAPAQEDPAKEQV